MLQHPSPAASSPPQYGYRTAFCPSPAPIIRRASTKSLESYEYRPRRVIYIDRGVGASPPPSSQPHPQPQPATEAAIPAATAAALAPVPAPAATPAPTNSAATTAGPSHARRPVPAAVTAAIADSTQSSRVSTPPSSLEPARSIAQLAIKRHASDSSSDDEPMSDADATSDVADHESPQNQKKPRADAQPKKVVPDKYEECDTKDLVILISSMLLELISYNDAIPLRDGHLTRFHSRAPPGISVQDYLQRLTTHATLSPPILLSMVYYIDRLCALYPAFTITSLTVHRFLIASATVASKGLSDSFWNNKTYSRVGGVLFRELALLELEFLTRLEWRIVPKPEVLVDYYRSLVRRSDTHRFEEEDEEVSTDKKEKENKSEEVA